jgi:hypothetical protein
VGFCRLLSCLRHTTLPKIFKNGCLWLSLVVFGCLWLSLVVFGCLWLSLVMLACSDSLRPTRHHIREKLKIGQKSQQKPAGPSKNQHQALHGFPALQYFSSPLPSLPWLPSVKFAVQFPSLSLPNLWGKCSNTRKPASKFDKSDSKFADFDLVRWWDRCYLCQASPDSILRTSSGHWMLANASSGVAGTDCQAGVCDWVTELEFRRGRTAA